jgi:hypothetical protein
MNACAYPSIVMRGLVPRIHVLLSAFGKKDVDGRNKSGHDGRACGST